MASASASASTSQEQNSQGLVTGSCLCKDIRYTLTGGYGVPLLCHCTCCRKSSGAAFMANSVVSKDNVNITDGENKIRWYEDTATASGRPLYRGFCPNCGSSVFIKGEVFPAGKMVVTSGSMDGSYGVRPSEPWVPQMEFACSQKGRWASFEGTRQYPEHTSDDEEETS